jgi:hypothetical protein
MGISVMRVFFQIFLWSDAPYNPPFVLVFISTFQYFLSKMYPEPFEMFPGFKGFKYVPQI